ncbi:MAG TPA: SGNH/GDSL hydrolase family protein [Actinophytocola sp.]|uniref:SGNH/GDSL hydrolase family protein n=1 Tax=Actinophytocola sp. TaxID=1872138 RepID=UPI002DDCA327|nr:SGNH/GDSL hydrolase family protein [Actinophytocola sp.]HEV2780720.1 SGNH/GDSL hydrolase family protein [Actinophytocola sp.]
MRGWDSWIALGDSFTEGLSDQAPDGGYIGWADRLAANLADHVPDFRYANIALRGKHMREILDEQVPLAVQEKPALVTLCGGGNDIVTPGSDVDEIAELFERAVAEIVDAGCDLVIFSGPDPKPQPLLRRVRGKVAIYNGHLRAIAERHGAMLVDLWGMDVLRDRRAWSEDRLHFSTEGHRRIALRTAEVLGLPVTADWREPLPPATPMSWLRGRQADLVWTRTHLLPWVRRQINGKSMGDGLQPKRPALQPICDPYAPDERTVFDNSGKAVLSSSGKAAGRLRRTASG